MNAPLVVNHLQRSFGSKRVLEDVCFTIEPGTLYGLIGRNGAGKTTTIESIVGLGRPDGGSIAVFGKPPRGNRRSIGHAPQEIAVYPDLTAYENIAFFADLYGDRNPRLRAEAVLETIGLQSSGGTLASVLSGGQRRLLNLGIALAHDPPLLILDEPTVGLDIEARENVWGVMRDARARGVTILLTTHYLEEADRLCDRVGILVAGRIAAEGTPHELKTALGYDTVVTVGSDDPERTRASLVPHAATTRIVEGSVQACVVGTPTIDVVVGWLQDVRASAVATRSVSLEDVYLSASSR
jgi:ABC-2 type transport system ATP-binding protein